MLQLLILHCIVFLVTSDLEEIGRGSTGDAFDLSENVCPKSHRKSNCMQRITKNGELKADPNCCADEAWGGGCKDGNMKKLKSTESCHGVNSDYAQTCCKEGNNIVLLVLLAILIPGAFLFSCVAFCMHRRRRRQTAEVRINPTTTASSAAPVVVSAAPVVVPKPAQVGLVVSSDTPNHPNIQVVQAQPVQGMTYATPSYQPQQQQISFVGQQQQGTYYYHQAQQPQPLFQQQPPSPQMMMTIGPNANVQYLMQQQQATMYATAPSTILTSEDGANIVQPQQVQQVMPAPYYYNSSQQQQQ